MLQKVTNTFYNREEERKAKAHERARRKETRHAQMLAALQGNPKQTPIANPKSLKNKAPGKCLVCTQAGQWAKECPNHGTSPKMACCKCHQLGH